MTGTVKKKVEDRMFGFITPGDGSKDVFFHKDALNGVTFEELREGDSVTFDVKQGPKGPAAENVQKA